MGLSIPKKPDDYSGSDPKKLMQHEEAMHAYWNAVQAAQAEFQERVTAESNMQKNRHDAMMAVIQNMKG